MLPATLLHSLVISRRIFRPCKRLERLCCLCTKYVHGHCFGWAILWTFAHDGLVHETTYCSPRVKNVALWRDWSFLFTCDKAACSLFAPLLVSHGDNLDNEEVLGCSLVVLFRVLFVGDQMILSWSNQSFRRCCLLFFPFAMEWRVLFWGMVFHELHE